MLTIKIATPDETLFDGQASDISIKTIDGVLSVLPKHVPVISPIVDGYYVLNGKREDIKEGMLIVNDNSLVTILVSQR